MRHLKVAGAITALCLVSLPCMAQPTNTSLGGGSTALAAALDAGDWRRAAGFGASAGDIVEALHRRGLYQDVPAASAAVDIGPDGTLLKVFSVQPLPALPGETSTQNLGGSGSETFGLPSGAITLRPPYDRQPTRSPQATSGPPLSN